MRKALRLLLALVLCMVVSTGALAEITLVPQLDEWDESLPLDVTLSADVAVHMPFDDNRCAQLNALMKNLSLHLNSSVAEGETLGRVALQVNDADVAWIIQKENAAETQLRLSWQPDVTYSAVGNALDMVSGVALEGIPTDKLFWLEEGPALVNNLCDALKDYGKSSSIKTNIKGMGMARKKIIYTVPKADAEFFWDAVADSCPDGSSLGNLLAGMTVSGQQKLIVWRDADGALLRMEYSGKCGSNADSLRQVKLIWRMCRTEEAVRDDISLKTPAVKGADYNTLTLTRNLLQDENGVVTLDGKFSYTVKSGKEKSSFSGEVDLKSKPDGEDTLLSGSVMAKSKQPGDDAASSTVVKPDVRLGSDGKTPFISGKVQVQELYDGHVVEDATISVEVSPGVELTWDDADITVDMDAMDEQQLLDMMQKLPGAVVPHLVLLPQEDTLYLSADLPEDVWQRIVEAAQSVPQEEVK